MRVFLENSTVCLLVNAIVCLTSVMWLWVAGSGVWGWLFVAALRFLILVDGVPACFLVGVLSCRVFSLSAFTESLILAQDERWRRA